MHPQWRTMITERSREARPARDAPRRPVRSPAASLPPGCRPGRRAHRATGDVGGRATMVSDAGSGEPGRGIKLVELGVGQGPGLLDVVFPVLAGIELDADVDPCMPEITIAIATPGVRPLPH